MAVQTYVNGEVMYEGCVIDTFERNGYDDSDFYALCWNDEKGKIVQVEYDSTRFGGGGWAKIDATTEVLRKVYRFYYKQCRQDFDVRFNKEQAMKVKKGDEVVVVRGRKIPQGIVGSVFWIGTRYNHYSHRDEERVGIDTGTERYFLPKEYVEVVSWEERMIHGRERKRIIRHNTMEKMPYWVR